MCTMRWQQIKSIKIRKSFFPFTSFGFGFLSLHFWYVHELLRFWISFLSLCDFHLSKRGDYNFNTHTHLHLIVLQLQLYHLADILHMNMWYVYYIVCNSIWFALLCFASFNAFASPLLFHFSFTLLLNQSNRQNTKRLDNTLLSFISIKRSD